MTGRGQRSRPWFSRGETKSVSSYKHKILYITLFRNLNFFSTLVDPNNFAFINLLIRLGVF